MVDDLDARPAHVVAVIQARMTSTRLPGKVLARMGSHSALSLIAHRLRRSRELDEVVVATSTDPSDDALAAAAAELGLPTLRGPLEDVLGRYAIACRQTGAHGVVRITADCPFIDPEIVDRLVRLWRETHRPYVTNTLEPRSFPDGLDVEVISAEALQHAQREATLPPDREHVTTFIRARPSQFVAAELRLEPSLGHVRMTLDTAEDLAALRALMADVGPDASLGQVLASLGFPSGARIVEPAEARSSRSLA